MYRKRAASALAALILLFFLLGAPCLKRPEPEGVAQYPWGSAQFDRFVQDSFDAAGAGKAADFHAWAGPAYAAWKAGAVSKGSFPFPGAEQKGFAEHLAWEKNRLEALAAPAARAEAQVALARGVHRMIKEMIPRFSLARGFEFTSVIASGERQCFLQSILAASLFQSMGMPSGVLMVYRNEVGVESNNGHAVTLLKLFDGRDVIVDASHGEPFPRHLGYMGLYRGGYRYVNPGYAGAGSEVASYDSGGRTFPAREVMPLDCRFIQSQFECYRGEWAPGGLHARTRDKRREGMLGASRHFERSIGYCPGNPLPRYLLARCREELGDRAGAHATFLEAGILYTRYGWVPRELGAKLAPPAAPAPGS